MTDETSDETPVETPDQPSDHLPVDVADVDAPDAPDAPTLPAGRRRIPLWVLILIGVVVGSLVGLGASTLFSGGGDEVAHLSLQDQTGDDAAAHKAAEQAFLDAWRRYRTATYSAELTFERVTKDGQSLRSDSTYTQQPPRRIVRQSDSVLLNAGADSRTCNTVNAQLVCAPAPNVDYAAAVDTEITTWKSALEGAVPDYVVSAPQANCFELDLAVEIADPPYGEVARFCFDDTTGALTQRQIVRATATDTEETTSITTVLAADAFDPTVTPTTTTAPTTPTTTSR
jgi:hypothetical protein